MSPVLYLLILVLTFFATGYVMEMIRHIPSLWGRELIPGWAPRFATYRVGGKELGVGARPLERLSGPLWRSRNCDLYLVLTTKEPTWYPPGAPVVWAPWVEVEPVPLEVLVISFRALNNFMSRGGRYAYVHCDAGSNRAPVVTGLWLRAYYPEALEAVVGGRRLFNHDGDPSKYYSCPREYSRYEIEKYAKMGLDLEEFLAWARGGNLDLEYFLARRPAWGSRRGHI